MNLAPGRYTVTAKLSGFADYRNENVPVTDEATQARVYGALVRAAACGQVEAAP